jgi:hypothetical protein
MCRNQTQHCWTTARHQGERKDLWTGRLVQIKVEGLGRDVPVHRSRIDADAVGCDFKVLRRIENAIVVEVDLKVAVCRSRINDRVDRIV